MNRGKRFEEDFFEAFFLYEQRPGLKNPVRVNKYESVSIDRVYDNTGGYAGVSGFCDFNVYMYPNLFHFELKYVDGISLAFDQISPHQFSSLLEKSMVPGICAGLVIEWERKTLSFDYHDVFYIDIRDVAFYKDLGERKSLTFEQCVEKGFRLYDHKKRTRYDYMIVPWLKQIAEAKKP